MYTFEFITVPLLTLTAVLNLVAHYVAVFGAHPHRWRLHRPFLQLLSDMGGLPRAVSYLLTKCFGEGYVNGREFFEKLATMSCSTIFNRIASDINIKYGVEGFINRNRPLAAQVLKHALTSTPIRRDTILGRTASATISVDDLEYTGHIFLRQTPTGLLSIEMPFIFISLYDDALNILPAVLKATFSQDKVVHWQDWEIFNAHFEAFITNFYVGMGIQGARLGEIFYAAFGTDTTLQTYVQLKPIEMLPNLVHWFPSKQLVINKETGKTVQWETGTVILVNAKGAPFGDTVSVRACGDGSGHVIMTLGQEKWDYNGKPFSVPDAVKEHDKALTTAKLVQLDARFRIVTVCFTSQPIIDEGSLPGTCTDFVTNTRMLILYEDGILVVARQNFSAYYGPFADRAAFAAATSTNPNFMDVPHLVNAFEGVGEQTAKLIAAERERGGPFRDSHDLKSRTQGVEIGVSGNFFPFE